MRIAASPTTVLRAGILGLAHLLVDGIYTPERVHGLLDQASTGWRMS